MAKIQLTCEKCGTSFQRERGEHTRNQKKGRRTYCSLKCTGNIDNIPKDKLCRRTANLNPANRHDKYSPFRWHLRNVRRRDKQHDLNLEYLKELWESQKGVCPYTGWLMANMINSGQDNQLPLTPDRASLDRIDSNKGYLKGNVQFVSYMAQCAKNVFAESDVLKFCGSVAEHRLAV